MSKISKYIEIALAACLYYSGFVMAARWWTRRSGLKLLILCYHRSASKNLRHQMMYLRRAYRVLHLNSALEELSAVQDSAIAASHRRTLLALTFDDGYEDNYSHAFMLAKSLRVPITVFLIPDYIDKRKPFSWLAGEDDHLIPFARVKEATIGGRTYCLERPGDQNALKQEIDNSVRFTTSIAERSIFLAQVREALHIPVAFTTQESQDLPMTWDEVREMEASGWVSFGSHTVHHPILACLTEPSEVHYEVSESRKVLEARLGHPVNTFAYPYGKPEQIGDIAPQAVRGANYDFAVTTVHGANTAETDKYLLHRIVVDVNDHWLVLAAKSSGAWDLALKPLRKPMAVLAQTLGMGTPYSPYH